MGQKENDLNETESQEEATEGSHVPLQSAILRMFFFNVTLEISETNCDYLPEIR